MSDKTIAAISTANGNSGISVIRISGDKAIEVGDKVFKSISGKTLSQLSGYSALFGGVYEESEKLDECIATVFRKPHSYTGEDVVELSCHGGSVVTNNCLRIVFENGATPAEAGEFTKRAFLNNKIDLAQAEAVMDIINAKSKSAVKAAMSIKEGHLSKKINSVKEELINKAAHLSAWADYPEEDIPEVEENELLNSLTNSREKLSKILSNYDYGQVLKNGINTVIVGKPNVGKSTLMNLLSGSEKSIVTSIPGTTRDVVEETVVLDNIILNLSDTAGIRESEDEVEKIGVDRAKAKIEMASLVIALFDNSNILSDEDKEIIENLKDKTTIIVINKTDLENKLDESIFESFEYVVHMSAKTEEGIDLLKEYVDKVIGKDNFDVHAETIYNERQRALVIKAIGSLDEAINAMKLSLTYDAITISIEEAISSLLELTGERVTEKVVDNVFHSFCVGK